MLDNQVTPAGTGGDMAYDGFMSYSHAADGLLAPRLQSALQRFAKPWWRRRSVRLFRDESSLSANPHLWNSITDALDTSEWFILLLSPEAARSQWVNQEIDYWVTHRDPKRILPVVTDGDLGWDGSDVTGESVPDSLRGVFSEEPRWVDLRFARGDRQLDLKDPRYADAVADLSAAIRGIPKDELASEEVAQHRRALRTAWAGGGVLVALATVAVIFALQSSRNAQLAASSRLSAEAARMIPNDPELASMLAVHAIDTAPGGTPLSAEASDALWRATQADRRLGAIDTGFDGWVHVEVSTNGERVLVASEDGARIQMYDSNSELLWQHDEPTTDSVTMTALSPDGRLAVTSIIDLRAMASARDQSLEDDDLPNRTLIFDGDTGDVVHRLLWEDCAGVEVVAISPDGIHLAVNSGLEGCERRGVRHWVEVFSTRDWSSVAFIPYPHDGIGGPVPEFDANGRLYLFGWPEIQVFEAATYERIAFPPISGLGHPLQDGSGVVVEPGSDGRLTVVRVPDGSVADRLGNVPNPVQLPLGLAGSHSGRWIGVGTQGPFTTVFDIETGEQAFRFPTGLMTNLAFDDEHARLYVGGRDGRVSIWDIAESPVGIERVGTLGTDDYVVANTMAKSERLGAVRTWDATGESNWIRFFRLDDGTHVGDPVRGEAVVALSGDRFAVDEGLRWVTHDPSTGSVGPMLDCQTPRPVLCPDSVEGSIVFDLAPVADTSTFVAYRESLPAGNDGRAAALNESGRLLDASVWDGAVFLVDETGTVVEDLTGSPLAATPALDPVAVWDDLSLVRNNDDLSLVDRTTGEVVWRGGSHFFDVDLDGRTLVFFANSVVSRIDLDTLGETTVAFDFGGVRGVSIEPGGTRAALGTADGLAIVDFELGGVAQTLLIDDVSDVHWIDDERALIGTSTGEWGVVSFDTGTLLEETRRGFRRGFTDAECTTLLIDPCPTLNELRDG